jgi:tetratricopeptide (TPR) repeat protein
MRNLRTKIMALSLASGLIGVLTWPAVPETYGAKTYDDCVALVAANPAQAEVEADRWAQEGGGTPALHCRALALLAQGARRRAAGLMVAIASDDRTLPDEVRSEILIEAGEVFLGLGELELGHSVAARALLLAQEPRAALTLSARLKAEQGDWLGAVNALDGALALGAPDADLLVLRASARLRLGDRVAARADLLWATEIAPDLASVWLERGALEEAGGDRDAARAAWLQAIDLDRDGAVGDTARLRLQRMDAGGN